MQTISKSATVFIALTVVVNMSNQLLSSEPSNIHLSIQAPYSTNDVQEKLQALLANNTRFNVPLPKGINHVGCK